MTERAPLLAFVLLLPLLLVARVASAANLEVLSVAERSYQDRPALGVILSSELDAKRRYTDLLQVTDAEGRRVEGEWVLDEGRRILYFPHVEPESSYTVFIPRALAAADGNTPKVASEHAVTTRKITPAFDFAGGGSILTPGLNDGLPIVTINTPEVDVEFLRVRDDQLALFVRDFYALTPGNRGYYLTEASKRSESVYMARFSTEAPRNARAVSHIPIGDYPELSRPGLYMAVMRVPGTFHYNHQKVSYFYLSEIGLHARLHADSMHLLTNSLSSGKPLADVVLELYDEKGNLIHKGFSDADGAASAPRPARNQVLIARHGSHISVLNFNQPALDLSEFETRGPLQRPMEAFVYANRDLFRPGEEVDISLLLRDGDGGAVAPLPLEVKLFQPDGRQLRALTLPARPLGYYQHTFQLPDGAKTGRWSLEVRTDPAAAPINTFRFHVEEFLPERMKLALESPQTRLMAKERWRVATEGAYLYGAPASGNRFKAVLNVRRAVEPLASLKGFLFGDVEDDSKGYREALLDAKLDAEGRLSMEVAPRSGFNSPMRVRLTGSLFESGGRPVSRSIERILWPVEQMVGIRPLFADGQTESDATAAFELTRVTPEGVVAPARNLEVTVIREDRDYYWEYDANQGWSRNFSESHYPILNQNLHIDEQGRAALRVPVEWGGYRLEVHDPHTGFTSRYRFHAGWGGEESGADAARPDKVNLTLDKAAYSAGDTVQVKIVPPHAGHATVMLEGDSLLWSHQLEVPAEGATIELPLDEAWAKRHDLYLTAVVVRPGDRELRVTPNRAVGLIHLPMAREARALALSLSAPEKTQPERPLEVELTIGGFSGTETQVTVAAVDVGILSITDFPTPDPAGHFFARRGHTIDAHDLYGRVIEALDGRRAKLRYGGDAMGGERTASPRGQAEVRTVDLFSGPVAFDTTGKATVSLPLPDFNGTLRLMAVAWDADRFASTEQEVTVAAPVVAELAMPRFLALGDRSRVTLELQNLSGTEQTLAIAVKGEGPLSVEDGVTTVTLADKERKALSFPLAAGDEFGVGRVVATVDGEAIALRRQWEINVRPPWPGERRTAFTKLDPGASHTLDATLLDGLRPSSVEATLALSSRPPLNVRSAVKGLLGYPYGCLEQTTSRAFPLLYIDETKAARYGLEPLTLAERAKRVTGAIDRIASMQLPNGGFGLWGGHSSEEAWLTPYAVHFLLEAREEGFDVPEALLESGLKRLEERLRGNHLPYLRDRGEATQHLRLAAQAYGGYVLARVQRAPLGALRNLFDHQRTQARSPLPLIHMGLALWMMGDQRRAPEAVMEGLGKPVAEGYHGDYGSVPRDLALVLSLIQRHDLNFPNIGVLIEQLSRELRGRRYLSTQERLAIFLAADALRGGGEVAASLSGGENERINQPGRVIRAFGAAELAEGITLTSAAEHPLYGELEVTGYTSEPPTANAKHAALDRHWFTKEGAALPPRPLQVGELVVARLTVTADRWVEHALVEELIPAGLEVENLNIGRGEGLGDLTIEGVKAVDAMSSGAIRHLEYRDDRFVVALELAAERPTHLFYLMRVVSPGSFVVPPPMVEDMYNPEWRAVGETPAPLSVENAVR